MEDFIINPEAPVVIKEFKEAGYLVIVVTNQPDVGNGFVKKETVETMHSMLFEKLMIDEIKVCYHRQDFGCDCRKPKAGMLLEAANDWKIDFSKSFMIGDRPSDIEAGQVVDCRTVFIDYGYQEQGKKNPDFKVNSLTEASLVIKAYGI